MSRYTKELDGNRTLAYGYDHAVGYFYDIFDNSPEIDTDVEGHLEGGDSLFGCTKNSSPTGQPFGNGKMLEVLTNHGVDEDHIQAVALDLPF